MAISVFCTCFRHIFQNRFHLTIYSPSPGMPSRQCLGMPVIFQNQHRRIGFVAGTMAVGISPRLIDFLHQIFLCLFDIRFLHTVHSSISWGISSSLDRYMTHASALSALPQMAMACSIRSQFDTFRKDQTLPARRNIGSPVVICYPDFASSCFLSMPFCINGGLSPGISHSIAINISIFKSFQILGIQSVLRTSTKRLVTFT